MKTVQVLTALVAGASAWYTPPASSTAYYTTSTTKVVTSYETYCPSPTTIAYKNVTYTVTEPTTLTITSKLHLSGAVVSLILYMLTQRTDCPCTLSEYTPPPVTTTCAPNSTYLYPNSTLPPVTTVITYPPTTVLPGTTVITPGSTHYPTGPSTSVSPTIITAGAGKAVGSGLLGLAAVGLAAFAL